MGTRADFYVGRGETAEWLGSIAFDGYPDGIKLQGPKEPMWPGGPMESTIMPWPEGGHLFDATTEEEYRARVKQYFEGRRDVSLPEMGWPWPWEDSGLTDFAYAFDEGKVWATNCARGWFLASEGEQEVDGPRVRFPNMKAVQNVQIGNDRAGNILIVGGKLCGN